MLPFTQTTLSTLLGAIPSVSSEWEVQREDYGFVELKAPNGDIVTIEGAATGYIINHRRKNSSQVMGRRTVYPEYWRGVVEVIQDFERSGRL